MADVRIALVSYDSLGDSLIYLMMADNLQINGFDVTLYGDVAHQLRHWVPHLRIERCPAEENFEAAFDHYTLALMSPPRFIREKMTAGFMARAREKWVLFCQKAPAGWHFDHRERLRAILPEDLYERLQGLASCAGSIRFRKFSTESVVDITLEYMRERMRLSGARRRVPLSPPAGLEHRRDGKRIIVSPDSAGPDKKEWSPGAFIKLCHALRRKGYEPHIVVAPRNHQRWKAMKGNVFETPIFQDINSLSAYIYESGALIANDSGNGHLASFLGVPVLTIYPKQNEHFHWRPGWGPGKVVCPAMRVPTLSEAIWRPFIRPARVLQELEKLMNDKGGKPGLET